MEKFYLSPTSVSPEINFSPEENIFRICGTSSPEDVRAIYYPVIEWITKFINIITKETNNPFSSDNPLRLQIDLEYFNSSSAKFLHDIFMEFKKLASLNIPVNVEWFYDSEDTDLKDAGEDIASLSEMEFTYIPKKDLA
jgi:hypothetical protein